jgi:hypothetical protein
VILHNEKVWRPIRKKVGEWLEAGWPAWKQDPPVWFTEDWIANIPDDLLPDSFAAALAAEPAAQPAHTEPAAQPAQPNLPVKKIPSIKKMGSTRKSLRKSLRGAMLLASSSVSSDVEAGEA